MSPGATSISIAVGEQVKDDLLEAGIGRPDQFSVIAPGVDIETIPEQRKSREQFDLPLNSPVLLFVGRLTQVKRPDRLIDAMSIVVEKVPEAVLVVAGGGEQLEATRSRARPLGDSVRFLGWCAEINVLCAAADLAVICSDNEGMPVTLIEAAFAGLPAVATDVGSVSEVVVDGVTGLLVEPTAEAVADGVVHLFEDAGLRARMATEASRRAIPRFGLERLIRQHDAIYQSSIEF